MARHYNYRYALIRARKQNGWSQKEVADKIFCSSQTVSRAELGQIYLDDTSAASEAFFVQVENLYGIPREILRKRGYKE
jgi:transcriptional regulator with XRE-family HTH domain